MEMEKVSASEADDDESEDKENPDVHEEGSDD